MREQSTFGVGDAAFRRADTAATVEDSALGPDRAGIQRDGADKRNLELERGAANALVEHRMDGEAHAAVEESSREPAVHGAPWVEMIACRGNRDSDAAAFGLYYVIAQCSGHRVERQLSAGKAPDELQPAHRFLLFGTDRAIAFGRHV